MFTILDGREKLYQWDKNRKLIVNDNSIKEVHFANCLCSSAKVRDTYKEGNITVVNVPDELLEEYLDIRVWGSDGEATKCFTTFKVQRKPKPEVIEPIEPDEPEVELITFYIDGKAYKAEPGMNHYEWYDSKYNVDKFGFEEWQYSWWSVGVFDYDPMGVKIDWEALIEDGAEYHTEIMTDHPEYCPQEERVKFTIDGVEYHAAPDMEEHYWVETWYNTNGYIVWENDYSYWMNEELWKQKKGVRISFSIIQDGAEYFSVDAPDIPDEDYIFSLRESDS